MGIDVVVRPAGLGDADRLGVVHTRAWQSGYRGVMPDEFLDALVVSDRVDFWRSNLSDDPDAGGLDDGQCESKNDDIEPHSPQTLVAEMDGEVVALATVGPNRWASGDEGPSGELYSLNAYPDAWGTGAATALLEAALAVLGEWGYRRAMLWVLEGNARARRFYEREGWVDDGITKTDTVGGREVTVCRYSWTTL